MKNLSKTKLTKLSPKEAMAVMPTEMFKEIMSNVWIEDMIDGFAGNTERTKQLVDVIPKLKWWKVNTTGVIEPIPYYEIIQQIENNQRGI